MRGLTHITVTSPSGMTSEDNRPGHTVSGLLYYLDPFQSHYSPRREVRQLLKEGH